MNDQCASCNCSSLYIKLYSSILAQFNSHYCPFYLQIVKSFVDSLTENSILYVCSNVYAQRLNNRGNGKINWQNENKLVSRFGRQGSGYSRCHCTFATALHCCVHLKCQVLTKQKVFLTEQLKSGTVIGPSFSNQFIRFKVLSSQCKK